MNKTTLLSCLCSLMFLTLSAQKKPLDFSTHETWKSTESLKTSEDGKVVSFITKPYTGDGTMYVKSDDGKTIFSYDRANAQKVHYKGAFVVFKIENFQDSIKKLKIDEVKKSKWPKDSLAVYLINADSVLKYADVKSSQLSKKGDWLALLHENNDDPHPSPVKTKGILWWKKEVKQEPCKTDGKRLVLIHPVSGKTKYWLNVNDYGFDESGTIMYFITHQKPNKRDSVNVYYVDLTKGEINEQIIATDYTDAKKLNFDKKGEQLVYIASKDTAKKNTVYELYYWNRKEQANLCFVDSLTEGLPEDYTVSHNRTPYFSESGERIFLGIAEIPRQEPKDTFPKDEKAVLDIWHWKDERIQPEQLKSKLSDILHTDLAYYNPKSGVVVPLGNDSLRRVSPLKKGDGNYAYSSNYGPFSIERQWEYPWKENYYKINIETGQTELIIEGASYGVYIHPNGEEVVYYQPSDSSWYYVNGDEEVCISFFINDNFSSDANGAPYEPESQGFYGWTEKGEVVLYSEKEIYQINPKKPKDFQQLTAGITEESLIYRFYNTHKDSVFVYPEKDVLTATHQKNQSTLIFKSYQEPEILLSGDFLLTYINQVDQGDLLFIRRMNAQLYPEIEVLNRNGGGSIVLSETNPQQNEYNWTNVEMIDYLTLKGDTLQTLIYTPENLDKNKKYPVIFYYYELYSDRIHRHYAPRPSASIINPTEYASNEYIVVIPDIRYEPGYPAQSAYDCIMGVTNTVLEKFPWIDSTKMGLQGQSWGGYQTAQLITMTTRYHAASAGAPVSNMFSAYGGIRWGSGLNRAFQYEKTQSRIGATIWEAPERYVENSPVFHLPKVETPILIMHNDNDGAVPWYQGIEMFMGLKRLQKPVWMLNYNNDDHNLMKIPNRKDLSIRLKQFFDTFLKDMPAPEWISDGVPAVDKGKNYGFDVKE